MKKLALAVAVLMGSVVAMPAMADNYFGQNQVRHDRQVARHMHRQEMHKIRHDRKVARKMHRQEVRRMHQERRMMRHQPAMVAPAVIVR